MPTIYTYDTENDETRHTDEMHDIITAVPPWLLRWGITVFFGLLLMIISLASFIHYPDIVNAQLKIESPNEPKPVVSKISGKLVTLLAKENDEVTAGQPLAFLESTANHPKVLSLLKNLTTIQQQVLQDKPFNNSLLNQEDNLQFGELQTAYQTFYQEYLAYRSSINDGFLIKKKAYLQKSLDNLSAQQEQLKAQKTIEQKDFDLAQDEYKMHKKLEEQKVETQAELRQEESKLLGKKSPLVQTESSLISGENSYSEKQNEILELGNQLLEEKSKFLQALNSLISAAGDWKSKYVLTAPQAGKLTYSGVIQENQVLNPGQEVFYVNPGNEHFFGSMSITQNNMGKVKEGEQVLIKLHSYPFEEYGMIRGTIKSISEVPYKDSLYTSKVDFNRKAFSDMKRPIHLKQGMAADAEIITQNATVFQRLSRSLFKIMDK
jgi:multidrug resistance efflux pump